MMSIPKSALLAARLLRQGFTRPAENDEEYFDLIRLLQPITPVAATRPGEPPRLVHRCTFDDGERAGRLRARQQLVKGRFAGGNVAYVLVDDLGLYANAFSRPMSGMSRSQEGVLDVVERVGPISAKQIKEETGLLSKEIGPALQRLQQAFLVFAEQLDEDWEHPWYAFEQAYPAIKISPDQWETAALRVMEIFIEAMVVATPAQCRDWSQFPRKGVDALLTTLAAQKRIVAVTVEDMGEGWMLAGETIPDAMPPESVYMLHKADFLVRAHQSELKEKYKGLEILEYLLIDGEFQGAVCGHWGFQPYDVEDIALDLSKSEQHRRREAIIMEVKQVYAPPRHDILRYGGEVL